MTAERRQIIETLLHTTGAVTLSELCARFHVSLSTVRRDLDELERRGLALRIHGGAVRPRAAAPSRLSADALVRNAPAKTSLADAAYTTLKGGETIFLDASSTASFLARRIVAGPLNLRILTNSAPVMQLVATAEAPNLELHAIGGRLFRNTASYVGPVSVQSISEHFVDKAFIGDSGVAPDGVLTTDEQLEAAVRAAMVEQADETVLAAQRQTSSASALAR